MDHSVSVNPRFAIRRCHYRDWPDLQRLIEECCPELTMADIRYLLCRHMRGIRTMTHGDIMSGFTIFYPTEEKYTAWFDWIGVGKNFRGKKLSAVLINDLSDTLMELGYRRLLMAVDFDNAPSLAMLDRQDGFRRISEKKGRVTFEKLFAARMKPNRIDPVIQSSVIGHSAYAWRLVLYFFLVKLRSKLRGPRRTAWRRGR